MKQFLVLVLSIVTLHCMGQGISKKDMAMLQKKEDSLRRFSDSIVMGSLGKVRIDADSQFTRSFVQALKTPFSFKYPFGKLQRISILYPPDSSFRIITWQLWIDENLTRQHGAIQMQTKDGALKLFPLIDKSDVIARIHDTTGNNRGWIGAVYYKLIETKDEDQSYYTLLGYDENDALSSRKIIEVLRFKNGEPWFGGKYFLFDEANAPKLSGSRFIMEFKKGAGARLTYDPELDMIVAEHLESETGEPKKKHTLVPDGDYEGFKWKEGRWTHVEKIFNQVTPEGKEPVPSPVKDAQGNTIESLLKDNLSDSNTTAPAPATPPARTKKKVGKQ